MPDRFAGDLIGTGICCVIGSNAGAATRGHPACFGPSTHLGWAVWWSYFAVSIYL